MTIAADTDDQIRALRAENHREGHVCGTAPGEIRDARALCAAVLDRRRREDPMPSVIDDESPDGRAWQAARDELVDEFERRADGR